MQQEALDLDEPRRGKRTGGARAALERSLKAWRAGGHLVGPAYAAAARVLRDSADAVDAARGAIAPARCRACGASVPGAYVGSPGSLAYANNIHAQLLAAASPDVVEGPDPYGDTDHDADLAAVVAAALAADPGAPPAAAGDPA